MMAKSKIISKPNLSEVRIRQKLMPVRDFDFFYSATVLEFAKGKKYFIRTYGCQANIRDEEILSGILEKAGFT